MLRTKACNKSRYIYLYFKVTLSSFASARSVGSDRQLGSDRSESHRVVDSMVVDSMGWLEVKTWTRPTTPECPAIQNEWL